MTRGCGMECNERMIKLYTRVYSRPANARLLNLIGAVSVVYVVAVYVAMCVIALTDRGWQSLARVIVMTAIPFLLVSLMRRFLNFQRPYEVIDFEPFDKMKAQRKAGESFPSRHVFSAFLIGTILFEYSLMLGVITLLVGVCIAAQRVVLGIHFIKDVTAGALIGALSGAIGMLFL